MLNSEFGVREGEKGFLRVGKAVMIQRGRSVQGSAEMAADKHAGAPAGGPVRCALEIPWAFFGFPLALSAS